MYNEFIMLRTPRDLEILKLVGKFGQLTTSQIKELLFHKNRSDAACDAVLLRLYKSRLLTRLGRTLVTVERGGSGEYVYALGSTGWPLVYTGRYRVKKTISDHTLAIADAYMCLVQAERAGRLSDLSFKPERAASETIGGQLLNPDALVSFRARGRVLSFWLEVDLNTEHRGQIAAMIERYAQAYANYDEGESFNGIVFVVACEPHKRAGRIKELLGILGRLPSDETRSWFRVAGIDDFPQPWLLGE